MEERGKPGLSSHCTSVYSCGADNVDVSVYRASPSKKNLIEVLPDDTMGESESENTE